jgi:putative oxidoreductase
MRSKEKIGLFILRFGLGFFMLLWSLDKLIAPESTVMIYKMFYKLPITVTLAYLIGTIEVFLSLAIIMGLLKQWTYGLGVVLHGISTLSSWEQLIAPFGKNHLFIAGLPILAAFITLYMLRDRDTFWSFDDR